MPVEGRGRHVEHAPPGAGSPPLEATQHVVTRLRRPDADDHAHRGALAVQVVAIATSDPPGETGLHRDRRAGGCSSGGRRGRDDRRRGEQRRAHDDARRAASSKHSDPSMSGVSECRTGGDGVQEGRARGLGHRRQRAHVVAAERQHGEPDRLGRDRVGELNSRVTCSPSAIGCAPPPCRRSCRSSAAHHVQRRLGRARRRCRYGRPTVATLPSNVSLRRRAGELVDEPPGDEIGVARVDAHDPRRWGSPPDDDGRSSRRRCSRRRASTHATAGREPGEATWASSRRGMIREPRRRRRPRNDWSCGAMPPGARGRSPEPRGPGVAEDVGRAPTRTYDVVFVSPAEPCRGDGRMVPAWRGSQLPDHAVVPGLGGQDASGGSPRAWPPGSARCSIRCREGTGLADQPHAARRARGVRAHGRRDRPAGGAEGIWCTLTTTAASTVEELRLGGGPARERLERARRAGLRARCCPRRRAAGRCNCLILSETARHGIGGRLPGDARRQRHAVRRARHPGTRVLDGRALARGRARPVGGRRGCSSSSWRCNELRALRQGPVDRDASVDGRLGTVGPTTRGVVLVLVNPGASDLLRDDRLGGRWPTRAPTAVATRPCSSRRR